MAPTRVLRVIARMNVGGPAVEIAGLMRHLDPAEFDQRLVTGWCDPHEEDYLTTQATDIPAMRVVGLGRAVRPTDDAAALGRLVQHIRAFRPDIVHTHTAKAGALGRVAARMALHCPRIVHTYHGHVLSGYFGPAKTTAITQVERALARGTDRLITVGAQVRDDLVAAGIGRLEQYTVIPPGLEAWPRRDRAEARAALGIDPRAQVVSVVGRITQIKRPDRVADVVARLAPEFPNLLVIMAGAGDLFEELSARITAQELPIRLLGWTDDVATVFAASDLSLLTSDNEGTPLSLIQAALSGIPVVATDVGAVREVLVPDETGLLAPPDADALAAQVARLLSDPALAVRMGEAGRAWAQECFTVERFAERHAEVYRGVLSGARR